MGDCGRETRNASESASRAAVVVQIRRSLCCFQGSGAQQCGGMQTDLSPNRDSPCPLYTPCSDPLLDPTLLLLLPAIKNPTPMLSLLVL